MSYLRTKAFSHAFKVRRLYKRALRELDNHHPNRLEFRYQAVLLRARFDQHKDEVDFRKAKQLLLDGERECTEKSHDLPFQFPSSPGGVAFEREANTPDHLLDKWHPLEKAQYPEYFARRDVRKREFIERYIKKYGKPAEN